MGDAQFARKRTRCDVRPGYQKVTRPGAPAPHCKHAIRGTVPVAPHDGRRKKVTRPSTPQTQSNPAGSTVSQTNLAGPVAFGVEPSSTRRRIVARALSNNGITTLSDCRNGAEALGRLAAVRHSGMSVICDETFEPSVVRSLVHRMIET